MGVGYDRPIGAASGDRFGLFVLGALVVWWAGVRLPEVAADLGRRSGLGQAFAGMLLLGGITTLPELATTTTAAAAGVPDMALNNVMGSAAFNVLLLAAADAMLGRRALTGTVRNPAILLQGVLGMLLLGTTAVLLTTGDYAIAGVGAGSALLFALCLAAMRISAHYETRSAWTLVDPHPPQEQKSEEEPRSRTSRQLTARLLSLGALVLVGGVILSQTGESIAERTGLGTGLVGLVLLAGATSLPEFSAISAAVRSGRYELAVGDIFGANLFNVAMIFIIDTVAGGPPLLNTGGPFEIVAALLALLLTGTYVIGLLERDDRTVLRLGYDSAVALLLYGGGIVLLTSR